MLSEKEKAQIRTVLEDEQKRLARTSQNALSYSMNHERNMAAIRSTSRWKKRSSRRKMRLHDREKFLLGKVAKQLVRLENTRSTSARSAASRSRFRRLLARPVTTLCIDCKEQSEREEAAAEQSGRGGLAEIGDLGDGEAKSPSGLED